MSPTEQANMPDTDFHLKNKEKPVDISTVKIDKSKPVDERIEDYITQTRNPYLFKHGKTSVEIQFAQPNAPPLEKIISDYFIRKKAHN